MSVKEMIDDVNHAFQLLDTQFVAAQQAFGIKPDLTVAEQRINDAGTTLQELRILLVELQDMGFSHPPDVVERFNSKYMALHQMAHELDDCKHIVHVSSHVGHKKETLN